MKVLFIYKNISIYEFKALPQLASVLQRDGHEVELIFAEREDPLARIRQFSPDIVGYSITTGLHNYYIDLNRRIKEQADIYSIFGGPHATYFPEIIEEENTIDAVCIGEGERATADFVNNFGTPEGKHTQNFWVRDKGRIIKNALGPLIEDLDSLPFWNRELIYAKDDFLRNNPQKTFIATRGCPLKCTFCHNEAYLKMYKGLGRMVRTRSVENLIGEIEMVKGRYPLGLVRFDDDFFGTEKKWMEEFAQVYRRRINIPFHCRFTVNMITPEQVELLKEAGCVSLQLGIESGDETFRKKVIKKNFKDEQFIEAFELLRRKGLKVISNSIIGLPGEAYKDALKTLDLNIKCRPAYAWCTIYQPYPKTTLAKMAEDEGYFDGDYTKIASSYYENSPLTFKNPAEKTRIENLQKLFALIARFPFLRPHVDQLTKVPVNPIYELAYRLWYGYTHQYILPQEMSFLHRLRYIKRFFVKDRS